MKINHSPFSLNMSHMECKYKKNNLDFHRFTGSDSKINFPNLTPPFSKKFSFYKGAFKV